MLRCPVCRSRRATYASMMSHKASSTHSGPCNCGGYHHPHRPGSACCDSNPQVRGNRARREGASDEDLLDAMIDDALLCEHKPCNPMEIPF
jgi:hypothetical protein